MSLQTDYIWSGSVVRLEPFVLSLPEPFAALTTTPVLRVRRTVRAEPVEALLKSLPVHIVGRAFIKNCDQLRCLINPQANLQAEQTYKWRLNISPVVNAAGSSRFECGVQFFIFRLALLDSQYKQT